jgi:hypothetical protein
VLLIKTSAFCSNNNCVTLALIDCQMWVSWTTPSQLHTLQRWLIWHITNNFTWMWKTVVITHIQVFWQHLESRIDNHQTPVNTISHQTDSQTYHHPSTKRESQQPDCNIPVTLSVPKRSQLKWVANFQGNIYSYITLILISDIILYFEQNATKYTFFALD